MVITAAAVGVGYGYALTYSASVSSEGNTTQTDKISIDVLSTQSGEPISSIIVIPYENDTVQSVTYFLKVQSPGGQNTFRLWAIFDNPGSWILVDNMFLDINGASYHFGRSGNNTGIPTENITLANGTYEFTIRVNYADVDLDTYETSAGDDIRNFGGSRFQFEMTGTMPQNP